MSSRAPRVLLAIVGAIGVVVRLVGVHALLHPGVIVIAFAIAIFVAGMLVVTRISRMQGWQVLARARPRPKARGQNQRLLWLKEQAWRSSRFFRSELESRF